MSVRALTIIPGEPGSGRLDSVDPPGPGDGLLVEVLAVGVCGTDHDLLAGEHGASPPGRDRLVIGHEMVGRVVEAADGGSPSRGELVAGIVRRPDPVPCANCAAGEWDMCANGLFTERGIKELDGYLAEQVRIDPRFLVPVAEGLGGKGVLVEPASVLAKAWEHIEAIGARAHWEPERVLVTGAGPIGLLAALFARQQGYQVALFDQVTDGPKPQMAEALGATYHVGDVSDLAAEADIIVECTGAAALVFEVLHRTARNGITCLTGVTSPGRKLPVPAGEILRELVLENDVIFGSVNANRRHYVKAVEALVAADPEWLGGLITRRVPLERWAEGLERREGDIKVVIEPG